MVNIQVRLSFKKSLLSGLIPVLTSLLLLSLAHVTSAQTTSPLNQLYTNTLCGISVNYPSTWIKEESNKKIEVGRVSSITLAQLEPDGFKSTVELEAGNIAPPTDKSIEAIADFQKEY